MSPSLTDPEASLSFSNLDEMREMHLQLLEAHDSDSALSASLQSQLLEFIRAGSALGSQLRSPKERQEAQGLLNFWISTFSSARSSREASKLPNFEPSQEKAWSNLTSGGVVTLLPFDERAADELAQKVLSSIKPKTQAEEGELTRLLAALIRLDNSTGEVTLAQLPEDDSTLMADGILRPTTRQLIEVGVLHRLGHGQGKGSVSLSNESLTHLWPFLESICQNRKALAQAAKAWDKTGRHRAALQPGAPLIKEASAYRDLSHIEQNFIEESRECDRNRLLIAALIALVVLLFAVVYLVYSQRTLSHLNRKLQTTNQKLLIANKKLETVNKTLQEANEAISQEKSNVEHALDLQKQTVIQEDEALRKAQEDRTNLVKQLDLLQARLNEAQKTEKSGTALDLEQQVDLLQAQINQAQRNAKIASDKLTQAQKYQAQLEDLANSHSKSGVVPKPGTDVFSGAAAEVFVSGAKSEFITKAQKFVDALLNAGIEFPVPQPQGRKHVADPKSEVRYYYKEDEPLAKEVMKLLIGAGIPDKKIMISLVGDKTAPQKFIQVSLANSAFAH